MFMVAEELAGIPEIPSGQYNATPHSYSKCSRYRPFQVGRISRVDGVRYELSANLC